MLYLHQSNRIENLLEALLAVLDQPLEAVFQAEIIAVEEMGMGRWLSHQIAERRGIAANIQFPLPAGFIWTILNSQFGQQGSQAGFGKSTLLWYAMMLLPRLQDEKGFESIKRYLSAADQETKTYQLSQQVADLFDQYLIYRPEMILRWEDGQQDGWQSDLWRAMRELSSESHWAGLMQEFIEDIERNGLNHSELPERVSLFAINALSPGYVELLGLIAQHIDVHLFLVNPSLGYWGDIVGAKDLAKLRARWRRSGRDDVSELYLDGNPLLSSMAQPCRDFLEQWHDLHPDEHEYFSMIEEGSLLSCLQADILQLRSRGSADIAVKVIPSDGSVQVHDCHSPMREVQVLQDRLLSLFDSGSEHRLEGLRPQDIVVVAPDINRYAPAIEAVFGAAAEQRHIPYSVANQTLSQQPLIEALLDWIGLPEERFEAPRVMGWLEVGAVKARLKLDDEAIERIRLWVAGSGIRWGLDGQHKQDLGLPANEHNTWAFGFRRLYLGYAMSDQEQLFQSVAPFSDIEGNESEWLGQLEAFIRALALWREEFKRPATMSVWQERFNRMIEQLLEPDEQELNLLDHLREGLARMVASVETAGFDEPLSADIMHQHLAAVLAASRDSFRLLSGAVSFCDMSSMRAIPFRVVCMLGLSDDQFPRSQRPAGFDLIAKQPRKGDRSLRNDDRYLFLQSLLAARELLHISYVGHSQQDNSARLPSVVVSELLEYIETGYALEQGELRRRIHIEHPLQPFSPKNFSQGSYADEWIQRTSVSPPFAAQSIHERPQQPQRNWISIDNLSRFLLNPARHFLEKGLGLHPAEYSDAMEEAERFELDPLQAYAVKSELLSVLIDDGDQQRGFELLDARGELPHGESARLVVEASTSGLPQLAQQIRSALSEREQPVAIDLDIDGVTLSGVLKDVVEGGLLRYRPAGIGEKDKLRLWLDHLLLSAARENGDSVHLGLEKNAVKSIAIRPLQQSEAIRHLSRLIELYDEGLSRPIRLLPRSSLAYATKFATDGDQAALDAARSSWDSSEYRRGDSADPWIALAFRDLDPYAGEFASLAREILGPMIDYSGKL